MHVYQKYFFVQLLNLGNMCIHLFMNLPLTLWNSNISITVQNCEHINGICNSSGNDNITVISLLFSNTKTKCLIMAG